MGLIDRLPAYLIDQDVEAFIHRRFPNKEKWTQGNCFYFAKILETRFPGGKILYEPLAGHFLYKYNNEFYDWTGKYTGDTSRVYDIEIEKGSGFYKELMRATFESIGVD